MDAPLSFYANWISRIRDAKSIPDLAAKLTPQKNSLRWLMEAALLGLSDEQAHVLTVMIRSMIPPVRDEHLEGMRAEAEAIVAGSIKKGSAKDQPITTKPYFLQSVDDLLADSKKKGFETPDDLRPHVVRKKAEQ